MPSLRSLTKLCLAKSSVKGVDWTVKADSFFNEDVFKLSSIVTFCIFLSIIPCMDDIINT